MSELNHKSEKQEKYKNSNIREKIKMIGFVAIFMIVPLIILMNQLNSQYKFLNLFN